MNEQFWHETMKGYIKNYESIYDLSRSGLLDGDENQFSGLILTLLDEIIEAFRQEVGD